MKIIISESQYDEMIGVDDIYDGLDPYYRRRIKMADISDKIDEKIDWVLGYYDTRNLSPEKAASGLAILMKEVVRRLIWESRVWGPEWGDDEIDEYDDLMGNRIMDKYGDEIKRKIIEKI
jgi:hypothetical protein